MNYDVSPDGQVTFKRGEQFMTERISPAELDQIHVELAALAAEVAKRGRHIILDAHSYPNLTGDLIMKSKPFVPRRETGCTYTIVPNVRIKAITAPPTTPATTQLSIDRNDEHATDLTRAVYNMNILQTSIENYIKTGEEQLAVKLIKPIEKDYNVPIAIWVSKEEAEYLRGVLGKLASHGILAAVSSDAYAFMKSQDISKARAYIRPFTAHNDKLGFDYSVPKRGYEVGFSEQFNTSGYPELLRSAAEFQ